MSNALAAPIANIQSALTRKHEKKGKRVWDTCLVEEHKPCPICRMLHHFFVELDVVDFCLRMVYDGQCQDEKARS